jgi:phage terminase large subunit
MSDSAYIEAASRAGLPVDALANFARGRIVLQPRQLAMASAARECDQPDGPVSIGVGGARGGGKSTWMLAQLAADDCQRMPNLKCLWLRKVGKANMEHLDDMRRTVLAGVPHNYRRHDGIMEFRNQSRIICGHFENEGDVDAYLGLEYDIIAIEEATTLTETKYRNIRTCCRSSKRGWRPRDYSTTNSGGIGHGWYKSRFVDPFKSGNQVSTRFVPSLCKDNRFNNPEYIKILESLTGWQRRAWLEGDWDIAAGQFFTTWRENVHVVNGFNDKLAMEWFCAMDYGFQHYNVWLLGAMTGDGKIYIVEEIAERQKLPEWHAHEIKKRLAMHGHTDFSRIKYFVAGSDMWGTESDGANVATSYSDLGIALETAEMDRCNGWSALLKRFGDPENGKPPTLFIHKSCKKIIEQIPLMQHDPKRPEDCIKVNSDEDGNGGDDAADCLRYLVTSYQGEGQAINWARSARVGSWDGSTV